MWILQALCMTQSLLCYPLQTRILISLTLHLWIFLRVFWKFWSPSILLLVTTYIYYVAGYFNEKKSYQIWWISHSTQKVFEYRCSSSPKFILPYYIYFIKTSKFCLPKISPYVPFVIIMSYIQICNCLQSLLTWYLSLYLTHNYVSFIVSHC